MRHLKYLLAAAALGSIVALPQAGSAGPLPGGLLAGSSIPALDDGLVQKVHGYHCRKRKGWYHGHRVWHRHYRACHRQRYYDDDYYDDDYDYGYYPGYYRPYGYGYPAYGFGFPFIGFGFGGFGGRHHHHNW
jgi:hypothetical protein